MVLTGIVTGLKGIGFVAEFSSADLDGLVCVLGTNTWVDKCCNLCRSIKIYITRVS